MTHHVRVLVDESLIKISAPDPYYTSYIVTLHDLIEYMGIEIVRQESIKEPGERTRLWRHDDIAHVLKQNTGTSKIEMIYLNCSSMEPININEKAFKKMKKLKTLIIEKGYFSKGLKYLPKSLIVLKWKGFTSEPLSFCFSFKKKLMNLRILTFDCSDYLTHIPDVSGLPELIRLSFQNCKNLTTIHNSVGYLYKLEILDATMCRKLKSFPPLCLPSLKKLELHFCRSLKSFPELLCKMSNIKEIWLCDTSIEEMPFSFKNLNELQKLVIMDKNFKILPKCLSECHYLEHLYLDYCESLEEIRGIPPNLTNLYAEGCKSLSSSSRRMLLSQRLHDAGCNNIVLPTGTEGIPDWFEHQVRGHNSISFWLCKKIPSITCIILIPEFAAIKKFNLFVNGNELIGSGYLFDYKGTVLPSEHAFLFDMNLDDHIDESFGNKPELYEAFKNNEWNHVELNWITEKDDHVSAQMGIHVSWEGDVIFTDPYIIERRYNERRGERNIKQWTR
ncbi:probable WRKY transcription factor 19 [Medicago truncatula]|nr:probable WRKY transcription factor 19 [Medicago truncatula]XP_039691086.1 probable WRKY transcription factor 19 [Medicago truncatula]XP_039691087.1 probable WRKY transcription factor 19 [Medicago truncatula]